MMREKQWFILPIAIVFTLSLLYVLNLTSSTLTVAVAFPLETSRPTEPVRSSDISLSGPDLVIESIVYRPFYPEIGEPVDITVTVRNQGDATASGFYTYLYLDPNEEPPVQTTTYTSRIGYFIPLNPGRVFKWARTNQIFGTDGLHPIYAWVDRDNDVVESDEINNLYGPVNICIGGECYPPDAYEEDDSCTQATVIPIDGTEQSHDLTPPYDEDWVKFDVIGGVSYSVQAEAQGIDASLQVDLFGSCTSPASIVGETDFEFTALTNGTYYIRVRHTQLYYGPLTDYLLSVTQLNNCNAYYEPNNPCSIASEIIVDDPAEIHSFCEEGDVDWVTFPVQAGSTYVISATGIGGNAYPDLTLYTSCQDNPPFGGTDRIEYTARTDGTVFIRAVNRFSHFYGPGTDYAIEIRQIGGCSKDVYEQDNLPEDAVLLPVGPAAQSHNFCPSGDVDWLRFDAMGGITYTIETFNLGTDTDTRICLYDITGTTRLVCDNNSGPGNGSRIVWEFSDNGSYALEVMNQGVDVAGPEARYDVRVFPGLCIPDTLEPDDARLDARFIPTDGSLQAHNTCPSRDVDWVFFTVGPATYTIETTDLGVDADTVIELFDDAGNQLAANDDYDVGGDSRIHYRFSSGGTYYLKVSPHTPNRYGAGTEYSLTVYEGDPPTPTPTPTPEPPSEPTPTPPSSDVRTLILVNLEQVAGLYGEAEASALMSKLEQLATHPYVSGEIVRLDWNETVSDAYVAWNADWTRVDKANQVAAAIRSIVMTYLREHTGVEYIVLVGDDRALPFRRIADETHWLYPNENDYDYVSGNHPTGSALQANYFLSDDYYADIEPTRFRQRELYIPDLAVGRLVETPAEIMAFIDVFLLDTHIPSGNVLVTGYHTARDAGERICSEWTDALGEDSVDCTLVGIYWPLSAYQDLQLDANPPFVIQSINGHSVHYKEFAPPHWSDNHISATEIANSSTDLRRGIIYTLGCHSGLNVPPENSESPLDLPQAFMQKGANYLANTGFGWGDIWGRDMLSERLMRLFTEELLSENHTGVGQALSAAKQRYWIERGVFDVYDEKVLEEATFYGLPMYRLSNWSTFGPTEEDPFPSVNLIFSLPSAFGDMEVVSTTLILQLSDAITASDVMSLSDTNDGVYYSLDDHIQGVSGIPLQPQFYADSGYARGVVLFGGSYETLDDFDPVIFSPTNPLITETVEGDFYEMGWYPPFPVGLRTDGEDTNLVIEMGQYSASQSLERLYSQIELDLYYSSSVDIIPPQIILVGGLYNHPAGRVNVKVGAMDPSGIRRALATYTQGDGIWQSVELSFDEALHKWIGSFPGNLDTHYFIQVVDGAGNVAYATEDGLYFTPGLDSNIGISIYLPLVTRQN